MTIKILSLSKKTRSCESGIAGFYQRRQIVVKLEGWGRSAAWLARLPVKEKVAGSNPVGPAKIALEERENFRALTR